MKQQFFLGKTQDWMSSFDLSDARHTTYTLLASNRIRIGSVETEVDLENLPWEFSQSKHPSWRLRFLSLKWLCPTIYEAVGSTDKDPTRIAIVRKIIKSWSDWSASASEVDESDHWHGHTVAIRTSTLVSASSLIDEKWLYDEVVRHAEWLSSPENWDGTWNHGLMQAIALLGVGYRLDRRNYIELAVDRIDACLQSMIDDEGCINEQAPAYSRFIYNLLGVVQTVLDVNADSRVELNVSERRRRLISFMAHATTPSGNFVQLGDSFRTPPNPVKGTELEYVATLGAQGDPPTERIAVYSQGFIFGRSGWGTSRPFSEESFYSLRFGPQRIIHGHNDHMSLTLMHKGKDVVVDSGHNGYLNDDFRQHLRSVDAHNVLRINGLRHDWSADTNLLRREIEDEYQFFELSDDAYANHTRSRSLWLSPDNPTVVVDRVSGADVRKTFEQLWHIGRYFEPVQMLPGHAILSDSESRIHLISFVIDAYNSGQASSLKFWKGSRRPHIGWTSEGDGDNTPSPVVSFSHESDSLFMVTLIAVVDGEANVGFSLRKESKAMSILRLHVNHESWTWKVSHGGHIGLRSGPLK